MSRKHNTKHDSRGGSNYGAKLARNGETSGSVKMRDYLGLNLGQPSATTRKGGRR